MGANKPIEDIEATLPAATKLALDELVWGACDDGGEGHRGISNPGEPRAADLCFTASSKDA
jgi:hypothetical protein